MTYRRIVKTTAAFENDLDRQLPEERTPAGNPSRLDFLLYELPLIIDVYATDFDHLPTIVGAPNNVRSLIGRGGLVQLYFVAGQKAGLLRAGDPHKRATSLLVLLQGLHNPLLTKKRIDPLVLDDHHRSVHALIA